MLCKSACFGQIEKFDKIHIFAELDGKVESMEKAATAGVINSKECLVLLLCILYGWFESSDGLDLVVLHTVHMSDCLTQ